MRSNGKQHTKPGEPSLSQLILPVEADALEGDQERDEDNFAGTRDYQTGTREFLKIASDEKGASEVAPDDAIEVLAVKPPDVKERKARVKTQRPSKDK
jgi:hypothetical protein